MFAAYGTHPCQTNYLVYPETSCSSFSVDKSLSPEGHQELSLFLECGPFLQMNYEFWEEVLTLKSQYIDSFYQRCIIFLFD